jgi:hypothetical protein
MAGRSVKTAPCRRQIKAAIFEKFLFEISGCDGTKTQVLTPENFVSEMRKILHHLPILQLLKF